MFRKPNILLITGDHTRHDCVACNHDPLDAGSLAGVVKTPNLDRLARQGATFANSYTTNPICVPARASITTGNYSHRCTTSKSNGGRILDDQVKLAEHFNSFGYATYAMGKLHYVPYAPPGEPRLLHGFQKCELHESGRIIARYDPLGAMEGLEDYHDFLKSVGWGGYERAHGVGNNDVRPATSPLPAEYHEEAWVAGRTIANLEAHRRERADQPFLMWMSFAKPHSPYDPPRPWDQMYDPREMPQPLGGWENDEIMNGRDPELARRRVAYGWDKLPAQAVQVIRAHYCAMMSYQDAQVGRVLQFLDETDLAANTIVVYTGDHGDMLGDLGRFFKVCMYDSSVKVPLIWRVPGLMGEGDPHRREQLAGSNDILPTLCDLTGCELPRELDGESLAPILRSPGESGREFIVSQSMDPPNQKYMIRKGRWKYTYCEVGGTEELYDAAAPVCDLENVAPEHTDLLTEFRQLLINWCIENGDEKMVRDGALAVSDPDEVLAPPEFAPGRMGWRKF